MVDLNLIFFNIGAFICACFVLDYGADRFIDHTVIVAKRLKINQTLIALLTAGAEWEELAVVIAAVAQHKPALALGNIIGSCISNILGGFSLGLLFRPFSKFDLSARVYSVVQLVVTTAVISSLATAGPERMGKIGGGILIASFVLYVLSVAWCIYRGIVNPPEVEQSDDDEDSSIGSSVTEVRRSETPQTSEHAYVAGHEDGSVIASQTSGAPAESRRRRLRFHVAQIVLGFLAVSLSGFVLSHSASTLASLLGISETVVGLTILSIATTIPEKVVSLMSGLRGHSGILVATTAGSNIFLLTLCTGVVLLGAGRGRLSRDRLRDGEIVFLSGASCIFTIIVWLGTKRWLGAVMFAGYVTFIVLEFTIWRR